MQRIEAMRGRRGSDLEIRQEAFLDIFGIAQSFVYNVIDQIPPTLKEEKEIAVPSGGRFFYNLHKRNWFAVVDNNVVQNDVCACRRCLEKAFFPLVLQALGCFQNK